MVSPSVTGTPISVKTNTVDEIRPLTGIRGFAAALIVFSHFQERWTVLFPSLAPFHLSAARCHVGVDLFFILSGFILNYVYHAGERSFGKREYRRFLWNRLARIYPNHLATLGLLVLLVVAAHWRGLSVTGLYPFSQIPAQLTLTHSWPIPGVEPGSWNYPSWSISAEWFAYLAIFPLTLRLLRPQRGAWIFLGTAYFALGLCLVAPFLSINLTLVQVSCEFVCGAMLFGVFRQNTAITSFCRQAASAFFLTVVAILCAPIDIPFSRELLLVLFPVLLLGLAAEKSAVGKVLASSPALWLGRVSYALYMSHSLVLRVDKILLPVERYAGHPLPARLFVWAVEIAVLLLSAAGLYYLVEVPSRTWMRRFRF